MWISTPVWYLFQSDAVLRKKDGRKGRRKEKTAGPPADVDINKLMAADREKKYASPSAI